MRKKIKMLEYHTDILSHFIDICMLIRNIKTIHDNGTAGCRLQLIQTSEKC